MEADLVPEKNGIEDGAPTEQDVMHKVVQMVNDALSADKNEKQKKLGEVYEIVFQQHPSLIPKILPDFLSFHQDSEPSIRKFVRHVIDEAIKLSHESLPDVLLSHCKDILIWFVSQDKNICASKKALQLAIRVWLRIRFTHIGPAEEMVRGFLDLLKEDEKLSQRDVLRLYVYQIFGSCCPQRYRSKCNNLSPFDGRTPSPSLSKHHLFSQCVKLLRSYSPLV